MKKFLSIVGLTLGLMALAGKAEAGGFFTSRSTGVLALGSTSQALQAYEQVEIVGVRVGSTSQLGSPSAETHFLVLFDTHAGSHGGGDLNAFNNCFSTYAVSKMISPPLYFASTSTVQASEEGRRSQYYPIPNVLVKSGLVACTSGGPASANGQPEYTIYFEIPGRRTTRDW